MTPKELDRVEAIAYDELIGVADEASNGRWYAYEAFIKRLRQEFASLVGND